MALRGLDQFPFILTSDGSQGSYPENKTSSFRILLKEPIDSGEEDWEVSLLSINYPYSWTNVGPSAGVSMKYYMGGLKTQVQEVNFPDWQCQSMSEVIKFMTKDAFIGQHVSPDTKIWLRLDELGRFKMTGVMPDFDVGFSDNMMKLLGLGGHDRVSDLTLNAFDRRQKHRYFLNQIWAKNKEPLNYGDPVLRRNITECNQLADFAALMSRYVNREHLEGVFDRLAFLEDDFKEDEMDEFKRSRIHSFSRRDVNSAPIADVTADSGFEDTKAGQVLEMMMYHLQSLFATPDLPKTIKGVTPCMMNPVQRMFIYINIIEPFDMNDKTIKLLKLVNTRGEPFKTTQEDYTHPTYMPLQKGKLSMIQVLIADESGDPVSFQNGTVVMTLHFRKAAQHQFGLRSRYRH